MSVIRRVGTGAVFAIVFVIAGCSGGGGGESSTPPPPPPAKTSALELLAGSAAPGGTADGVGPAARFRQVTSLAVDGSGNVYVADQENLNIRKMDSTGAVSTLAGTTSVRGVVDGPGTTSRFYSPTAIAADSAGNVYVSDGNRIRKIARDATVSTLAGIDSAGSADGVGGNATFSFPSGLAADTAGNVFVADRGNSTIRKITPNGVVTTVAGVAGHSARVDGAASVARFTEPYALAIDALGNLYVSEIGDHSIRKVTPSSQVSTFAGQHDTPGKDDGLGGQATFGFINGLAFDQGGNLLVEESLGDARSIRKMSPGGNVTTYATSLPPTVSLGFTVDRTGRVLLAENLSIVSVAPGVNATTLVAGEPDVPSHDVDGVGSSAVLTNILPMATAADGTTYTVSVTAGTLRKITPAGAVTTLVLAPQPITLRGVAIDPAGNLFVLQATACFGYFGCHYQPARVSSTGQVTPIPVVRSSDGSDVTLSTAISLAVDKAGNIYLPGENLLELSVDGNLTTVVKGSVNSVAFDSKGVMYWASGGTISRTSQAGPQAVTGGVGVFSYISQISFDPQDNLYVADSGNVVIRKVTPNGSVVTIAGTPGVYGFNPGPLPGTIDAPRAVTVNGGNLYIGMPNGMAVVRNVP